MGSGASQVHFPQPQAASNDLLCSLLVNAPQHSWMIYEIFGFLPWKQSLNLLCASKVVRGFFLDADSTFWRWLCRCIGLQNFLFLPPEQQLQLLAGGDFKALAQELALLQHFSHPGR